MPVNISSPQWRRAHRPGDEPQVRADRATYVGDLQRYAVGQRRDAGVRQRGDAGAEQRRARGRRPPGRPGRPAGTPPARVGPPSSSTSPWPWACRALSRAVEVHSSSGVPAELGGGGYPGRCRGVAAPGRGRRRTAVAVDHHPQRLLGDQRAVAASRTVRRGSSASTVPTPTTTASHSAPQPVHVGPGLRGGDPPAGAVGGGDPAVEGRGELPDHERTAAAVRR